MRHNLRAVSRRSWPFSGNRGSPSIPGACQYGAVSRSSHYHEPRTRPGLYILHGRFSGIGRPVNWIVFDIFRIENGLLAEHWDVIQDETTQEASKSGFPMFGDKFPD